MDTRLDQWGPLFCFSLLHCLLIYSRVWFENVLFFTIGFNGKTEYDYNGYITQLLIAAHNIDPIFQKEC